MGGGSFWGTIAPPPPPPRIFKEGKKKRGKKRKKIKEILWAGVGGKFDYNLRAAREFFLSLSPKSRFPPTLISEYAPVIPTFSIKCACALNNCRQLWNWFQYLKLQVQDETVIINWKAFKRKLIDQVTETVPPPLFCYVFFKRSFSFYLKDQTLNPQVLSLYSCA